MQCVFSTRLEFAKTAFFAQWFTYIVEVPSGTVRKNWQHLILVPQIDNYTPCTLNLIKPSANLEPELRNPPDKLNLLY